MSVYKCSARGAEGTDLSPRMLTWAIFPSLILTVLFLAYLVVTRFLGNPLVSTLVSLGSSIGWCMRYVSIVMGCDCQRGPAGASTWKNAVSSMYWENCSGNAAFRGRDLNITVSTVTCPVQATDAGDDGPTEPP